MLASAPSGASVPDEADLSCYRLMAELARAEDPAVRRLGLTAAQFFLGRIDAAAPGYELGDERVSEVERPELLRRCAAALEASGFEPGSLASSLEQPESTI